MEEQANEIFFLSLRKAIFLRFGRRGGRAATSTFLRDISGSFDSTEDRESSGVPASLAHPPDFSLDSYDRGFIVAVESRGTSWQRLLKAIEDGN